MQVVTLFVTFVTFVTLFVTLVFIVFAYVFCGWWQKWHQNAIFIKFFPLTPPTPTLGRDQEISSYFFLFFYYFFVTCHQKYKKSSKTKEKTRVTLGWHRWHFCHPHPSTQHKKARKFNTQEQIAAKSWMIPLASYIFLHKRYCIIMRSVLYCMHNAREEDKEGSFPECSTKKNVPRSNFFGCFQTKKERRGNTWQQQSSS